MRSDFRPIVRLAAPGELRAYVVYEHQLDTLTQGQPAGLMLNFALFLLGVAATGFGTVVALPAGQNKAYNTFLIITLVSTIAGAVLFVLWLVLRRSLVDLVAEIKAQMPPNPEAEQVGNGDGSS